MVRLVAPVLAGALLLAACSTGDGVDGAADPAPNDATTAVGDRPSAVDGEPDGTRDIRFRYPQAPVAPVENEPSPGADEAVDRITDGLRNGGMLDAGGVTLLAQNGDARHAWYVADLMRFFGAGDVDGAATVLVDAFETLTGATLADDPDSDTSVWLSSSNHLIAWDTPAYPGYREDKSGLFLLVEPAWEPFFADADADIDLPGWHRLGWRCQGLRQAGRGASGRRRAL